jgi:hypothetical protein
LSDENPNIPADETLIEKRSIGEVAQTVGVFTGGVGTGVGTLLLGVAQVKQAFGKGDGGESPPQADSPPAPDEPK